MSTYQKYQYMSTYCEKKTKRNELNIKEHVMNMLMRNRQTDRRIKPDTLFSKTGSNEKYFQ